MNPLFQRASKALQDAAMEEFRRHPVGQLAAAANSIARSGTRSMRQLKRLERGVAQTVRTYGRSQFDQTDVGRVFAEVEKYAKENKPTGELFLQFLESTGPFGKLLKSMLDIAGSKARNRVDRRLREIESAVTLLRSRGFEIFAPNRANKPSRRDLDVARELLERAGFTIIAPTSVTEKPREVVPPETTEELATRERVQMIAARSSNVHSFGYAKTLGFLYVRFLTASGAKGSLYEYAGVTPQEFESMKRANSKGRWVWDHLRIRGTVSGHRKDYRLAGITRRYVPRKATLKADGEWYVKRVFMGIKSQLPEQRVRSVKQIGRG